MCKTGDLVCILCCWREFWWLPFLHSVCSFTVFFCQAVKLQPVLSHSETDAVHFFILWSGLCNNAAICESFSIGEFTSGNEEDGIFSFWGVSSYPFFSIHRSLVNSFIHISASGPLRNWLYSCDIPVIGSITALDFKWLHAPCAVRICVVGEYLEAIWSVLVWCRCSCYAWYPHWWHNYGARRWHPRLRSCSEVWQWHPWWRQLSRVYSRKRCCQYFLQIFMAWYCSSPTGKGGAGSGFLKASVKYSTD